MLEIIELKKRYSLVLNESKGIRYTIYPSTQEESLEIVLEYQKGNIEKNEKFDFLSKLNLVGHVNDVFWNQIREVIPVVNSIRVCGTAKDAPSEIVNETKCYQENKTKSKGNNIILHEDRVSSLKCACERIKSNYFIILEEVIEDGNIESRDT